MCASFRQQMGATVIVAGQFLKGGGLVPAVTDEVACRCKAMPPHELPQILLHPVNQSESPQHHFGAHLNNRRSQEHEFRRVKNVDDAAAGHHRQAG
jgi:hypothetical protein